MAMFNSYVQSSEGEYRFISLRNIPVLAEPRCVVTPFFDDEISVNPRIDEIFFGCSSFVSWTQSDHTFPISIYHLASKNSITLLSGIAAPPVEDFYEELRCLALSITPLLPER